MCINWKHILHPSCTNFYIIGYNTNFWDAKQLEALILLVKSYKWSISLSFAQILAPIANFFSLPYRVCFVLCGRCLNKNLLQHFPFLNHLSLLVSWQYGILVWIDRFRINLNYYLLSTGIVLEIFINDHIRYGFLSKQSSFFSWRTEALRS